jgi:hypothetical protein
MMQTETWQEQQDRKNIAMFDTDTVVDAQGVVRWKYNEQVPMHDMMTTWAKAGKSFDLRASLEAREADTIQFMGLYRKAQARRTPEQIREMQLSARAAHGPGVVLVDIITGGSFTT